MKKGNTKKKKTKSFNDLSLAEKLADILHDKQLPAPMYSALRDGLADMFNSYCDQTPFIEYERSPGYIQMLMNTYTPETSEAVH